MDVDKLRRKVSLVPENTSPTTDEILLAVYEAGLIDGAKLGPRQRLKVLQREEQSDEDLL